jgi:hypothetical protein
MIFYIIGKQFIMTYTKEQFTKKLIEFFERHDPLKIHLVDEITNRFYDQQEEVFKHLTALYAEKNEIDVGEISNDSIFSIPPSPNSGYMG